MAGNRPNNKSDTKTVEQRIEEIYRLLLAGATRSDIILYSSTPNTQAQSAPPWNVSTRQIDKYIARAYEKFAAVVERRNERLFDLHFARREDLYAKALAQGNVQAAAGVLKDLDTFLGMYPQMFTQEKVAGMLGRFMEAAGKHLPADKLSAFLVDVEAVLYQADPDGKRIPRSVGTTGDPSTSAASEPECYDSDLDPETLDPTQPPG